MGNIFCIMGKSSSGKDTLYKKIVSSNALPLKTLVSYTTRPIRQGETNNIEYFFSNEETLTKLLAEKKVIELRSYDTIHGTWKYFTVDDHQLNLDIDSYLVIGTLESYRKMQDYFGIDRIIPIYIVVADALRLQRALDRERAQEHPCYQELCRRFLADDSDFSKEKLLKAGINRIFQNEDSEKTKDEIITYISGFIS
ncbi:guanylate kinase [Lachnospiraceae bacterium ZAX-1]